MPIRDGIVGTSFAARRHADALRRVRRVALAAIAGLDPERSRPLARELGADSHHDPKALLDDPSILNPLISRAAADQEPRRKPFCPRQRMVGGVTTHWTGWVSRFIKPDFKLGDVPGASPADCPIDYDDGSLAMGSVDALYGLRRAPSADDAPHGITGAYSCGGGMVQAWRRWVHAPVSGVGGLAR